MLQFKRNLQQFLFAENAVGSNWRPLKQIGQMWIWLRVIVFDSLARINVEIIGHYVCRLKPRCSDDRKKAYR